MTFGGQFGPGGNLVPFGLIKNIKGEIASGYDAAGRIVFINADGEDYTPERVDTLIIVAQPTGQGEGTSFPLGAATPGIGLPNALDVGTLVSAVPGLTEHGLPTNFGPGRGNWNGPTGHYTRLRLSQSSVVNVPALAVASSTGGVEIGPFDPGGSNVAGGVRNLNAVALVVMQIIVECIHSVQG